MVRKSLLQFLYEAASMQRWNDHIRPNKGFTELDKQSHKMMFAYVLAKFEESDKKVKVDWIKLIEGSIFEFLHRIILTDIKPTIFHKLMQKHERKINHWVLLKLKEKGIEDVESGFYNNMEKYFMNPEYSVLEKRILKASHYLATNWEFKIIYKLNADFYGLSETKERIENEIEEHYDLAGVQKLSLAKKTRNFLDLIGQLRFQQRWAQSPRVPETSVLGHMYIVAILSYLFSLELRACEKRICNNFLAGLFHDLPEVLTRDIISPVKSSVEGLGDMIKQIEEIQVEERIFPLIPSSWHNEIEYFTKDEFKSKVVESGKVKYVSSYDINSKYNCDDYLPVDGQVLEVCDKLAAYLEAHLSISHGIKSHHLEEGKKLIYERFKNTKIAGINFGQVFDYFKTN